MIIKILQSNRKYEYSKYKTGDVLEVVNEYDEHYVCKMISGSEEGICAVYKGDCELVHLGSYKTDGPETMAL